MLGCVIQYGQSTGTAVDAPIAAPVSFAELEAQLTRMSAETEDVAQIARLNAARDLARQIKTQSPQSQQVVMDYLLAMTEAEARTQTITEQLVDLDEGAFTLPPIQEEVLLTVDEAPPGGGQGGSTSAESVVRIVPLNIETLKAEVRILLAEGHPREAMAQLDVCKGESCWGDVAELWAYARDTLIHQQREEASHLLLRARAETDAELKRRLLRETEEYLFKMLAQYPNTRHTSAIQASIELVQSEIAAAGE
jgi:hypothetical protein